MCYVFALLMMHVEGGPLHNALLYRKLKLKYLSRVSSMVFQLGGPASLTSQILYLITMLGKSLTRSFPGVAIKQRVWSARLGFSRSSMQRDLSMPECIPLTLLEGGGGDFGSLQGWADLENLEGWDLIEAKANILNKKIEIVTLCS